VRRCHAFIFPGIAFPPWPFQLLTDRLDAACNFLKFAPLDPVPTLQHLADASKFLGKGLEAKFSVSNIQTYPQNFADISLVIRNTLVGSERLDPPAVAQHVCVNAERITIGMVHDPGHKCRQISALKTGKGRQRT
jgi:hypothetical protein